jgi:TetR/AcrR family transcriptional regulator, ethionamide resistance regulator
MPCAAKQRSGTRTAVLSCAGVPSVTRVFTGVGVGAGAGGDGTGAGGIGAGVGGDASTSARTVAASSAPPGSGWSPVTRAVAVSAPGWPAVSPICTVTAAPGPTVPTAQVAVLPSGDRLQLGEEPAAANAVPPGSGATSRAELTRTAFYRHFEDRQLLLLALLEDVGVRLEDVPAGWRRGAEDPAAELRRAFDVLASTYARHGRLLAAIAEAAAQDAEVRAVYHGLADRLIAAAAERIAAEVTAGRSRVADPGEVARALIWMNEAYLQEQFGRAPLGDAERAAAALAEIWLATIYGAGPPDPDPSP